MYYTLILALFLSLSTACSTSPTPLNQATSPHFSAMPRQDVTSSQTAKVVLVRDQGRAWYYDHAIEVAINQQIQGEMGAGEQVMFHVETGEVEVAIKPFLEGWKTWNGVIGSEEVLRLRVGFYEDPWAYVPILGFWNDSETFLEVSGG